MTTATINGHRWTWQAHSGDIYLDGKRLIHVADLEAVLAALPALRKDAPDVACAAVRNYLSTLPRPARYAHACGVCDEDPCRTPVECAAEGDWDAGEVTW